MMLLKSYFVYRNLHFYMQTKNHCHLEATIIIKNRCFLLDTDYMPNTLLDNHHV